MTVCRTAVEPFFSVSWGSGLSDQMQGRGFDVFLGYSFTAFSSLAASGAIEQRPARKLGLSALRASLRGAIWSRRRPFLRRESFLVVPIF